MDALEAAAIRPMAGHDGRYPLALVGLHSLMGLTAGRAEIAIGLIDGPVAADHAELADATVRPVDRSENACVRAHASCVHGTFVAGVLVSRRGGVVPAICPECTLLVRPIFHGAAPGSPAMPRSAAPELASAIRECIHGGARLLNISAALVSSTPDGDRELTDALDLASRRGVLVVAAAGNDGLVGSSAVTRHRWVVPVVAFARSGMPLTGSTLGRSIGRNGVGAPGEDVISLNPSGGTVTFSGTSAAAPFVTGAAALLWSEFPTASAARVRCALTRAAARPPRQATPPLMSAWNAYRALSREHERSD